MLYIADDDNVYTISLWYVQSADIAAHCYTQATAACLCVRACTFQYIYKSVAITIMPFATRTLTHCLLGRAFVGAYTYFRRPMLRKIVLVGLFPVGNMGYDGIEGPIVECVQ